MIIEVDKYIDVVGLKLEHSGFTDDEIDEYMLEHHGVKGMRWGERRARRLENRAKNKAAYNKDITDARAKFKSGEAKRDYKQAKLDYKSNKAQLGSYEARKILNQHKNQRMQDKYTSQQAKTGKESAILMLATVGIVAASVAFTVATRKA